MQKTKKLLEIINNLNDEELCLLDEALFSYILAKAVGGKDDLRVDSDDVVELINNNTHLRADGNGSVGVIVVKDGKVLTGKRLEKGTEGQICGPGGHIEQGETPEQAAVRESREEFNITPTKLIPMGDGPEESNGLQPFLFLCTEYDGEIKCDEEEMTEPRFLSVEEIEGADNLFKPFADGVKIAKGRFNSDYGILGMRWGHHKPKVVSKLKGKIKACLENEFGELSSDKIVLTEERDSHIKENHPESYEKFMNIKKSAVTEPDVIFKDNKANTADYVKQIDDKNNIFIVVRVALAGFENRNDNSIITSYMMRNKNMKKFEKTHKIIYKAEK